ncbi:MAG: hypothetical protein LIO85_02440 [Rikenellaceae bacterium]|nr:hypothetical protein [Rikenellaceae bacterium]
MRYLKLAALLFVAGFTAVSCGERESVSYTETELESFEAWMAKYINTDPADKVATELPYGGYIQWLHTDNTVAEIRPEWGDYVEINYRGMLLSDWDHELERGSIFMTRWEEDAERLGTFNYYCHYVPQLIIHNLNNYIMPSMQQALQLMKQGDVVRLYLPSDQSSVVSGLTFDTSSNSNTGYGGNTTQPTLVPVIVEMELVRVVEQPQTDEERFVIEYAATEWGQTVADSVRQYIFMNIEEETSTDIAGPDSSLTVYYAARLAYDGFLLGTNIDSIAEKNNRTASTYVSYTPSSGSDNSDTYLAVQALSEIFETGEVTYGSWVEFITTSMFAFGSTGQDPASTTTEILPYQPLIYTIYIDKYGDDDDEEEDDE